MRIIGVDIPNEKRVEIALTYIYGLGRTMARRVLQEANVDVGKKAGELTSDEVVAIRDAITTLGVPTEGELRRQVTMNIKRLMEVKCWRGMRHRKGLPVRGQRTHTNARTRKGPRKQAIAGKKRAGKK